MRRDTQVPNGRAMLGGLAHDAAAGANLALTMLHTHGADASAFNPVARPWGDGCRRRKRRGCWLSSTEALGADASAYQAQPTRAEGHKRL